MIKEQYRLKKMAHLVQSKRDVLDLGCAALPNPYLSNTRVVGLDIADCILPENYTEVISGNVMNIDSIFDAGSFESIVAGEIIEHLENPMLFLKKCRDILNPGGILVLSTPNPNSCVEQLLTMTLSRKFFYTEGHVMLFPQRWLIRMLERSGFSEVKLHSGGMIFPVLSLIPFPRPWCYQTIASAKRE